MLHVVAVRSRKWRIPRSPPRSRKERNLVSFFLVVDSLHLQLFLANTMTKTLTVCSTYCKIIPTDTESKVRVIDVGEIDASTMMFFFFFCVCVCFCTFCAGTTQPLPYHCHNMSDRAKKHAQWKNAEHNKNFMSASRTLVCKAHAIVIHDHMS